MSGAASPKSTDRSEAPLPDALGLLVREKLTGQTPPAKARAVVNLWRPWIEGRARTVLDRMPEMLFDQEAFGRLTRELLAALNLADKLDQREDEEKSPNESEADADASEGEEENSEGEQRADLRRFPRRAGCFERGIARRQGRRLDRPPRPRGGRFRAAAPLGAVAPQSFGAR